MSHLISTPATAQTCPRCGAPILTALDEGIPARVDQDPVDNAGEISAILDGRWTFVLTQFRHLVHRDAHRITAGKPRGTIHAEHHCTRNIQTTIDDMIGQPQ
jgi:hypothetical protein